MTKECECHSWASVYSAARQGRGVSCGQAFEFSSGEKAEWQAMETRDPTFKAAVKAKGEEVCTNFLEKLDANYCMKGDKSVTFSSRADTWCYTSPKCTELNGGAAVKDVAWKKCQGEGDKFLGELAAPELMNLAKASGVHPTQLIDWAYTHVQADPAKMNLGELSELAGGFEAKDKVGVFVSDENAADSSKALISNGSVYRYSHRDMGANPKEFLQKHSARGLLECVGGCPTGTLIRSFKSGI